MRETESRTSFNFFRTLVLTLQFILLKLTNISAEIKGFAHQKFTLLSKTYIIHTSHRINTNDFNAFTLSAKDKIKYENEMIIFRR